MGYRRVGAELRHQGIAVNSKKIRRLMREHGLQPKHRRRFVVTTDRSHNGPIFPNLARDRIVDGPNQLWGADITCIAIATGFVYLAAFLMPGRVAWSATRLAARSPVRTSANGARGLLTTSAFIVWSPLLGFFLALLLMLAVSWTVVRANPRTVERTERPDLRIVASLLPKQRMLRLTTGCGFIGCVSGSRLGFTP